MNKKILFALTITAILFAHIYQVSERSSLEESVNKVISAEKAKQIAKDEADKLKAHIRACEATSMDYFSPHYNFTLMREVLSKMEKMSDAGPEDNKVIQFLSDLQMVKVQYTKSHQASVDENNRAWGWSS